MNASCEQYETYTIKLDSRGATSNSSFVGYLNIPLRNVVKAELLSASIASNAATTPALYVYVNELVSKFNDKADLQMTLGVSGTSSNVGSTPTLTTSNTYLLHSSLVCVPTEQAAQRTIFTSGNFWDTSIEFIEPIRQIQTLTVIILKDDGNLPSLTGATHLVLRFTCAKPNKCLY